MKLVLNKELCYMAGLCARSNEPEKSRVGIVTRSRELSTWFVQLAIALGVEPNRILIEEKEGLKHVYFFHSKIARQIREIRNRETFLFKPLSKFSSSYVAGFFDANAHKTTGGITLGRLNARDRLMFENLGIHFRNDRITNFSLLEKIITKESKYLHKVLERSTRGK